VKADGCVLCDRARTLDTADPGWLLRSDSWAVSTHPAMSVPGWLAVQTIRHTEGLAGLDAAEAADLGPVLRTVSAAVTQVTGSRQIYTYSLGEGCPHTHILVGPPSAGLRGGAFIGALMRRDESLADQDAAERTAAALADELSTRATIPAPVPTPTAAPPRGHPEGDNR
jgi:diadenosine tetraphosphate (Ap4A) HIT family hydrolase